MKCIIFGGGGFIGSTIADKLLAEGHHVKIFERPRVPQYRIFSKEEKIEWVSGDFSSSHDIAKAINGMDAVLHLVSTTLPKSSNEDPVYDVESNVVSTLKMLNESVAQKIKKIIFISSGGTVYGSPIYLPIDEIHPTNPIVSYGVTKLTIEKYLKIYQKAYGIQPIILRVANPYGERQRVETAQGAVGVFINRALRDMPIEIWGDGSITRDYIHVSDVADAFSLALQYSGSESCFNISSGTGTSLNQLIDLIDNNLENPVKRNYQPGRPFDVPISVLSNQLAIKELNWKPSISIEDGITRTAKWMRNQLN